MPAVPPPGSKILVTGANGFVAVWVIRTLLEQGYIVRGTVRSESKGAFLRHEFLQSYGDRFELAIVSDFLQDGAFDDAVKGVDAIQHLAAPVIMNSKNPKEVIDPAIKGTLGILRSAQKTPSVKRVILMGSAGAVVRRDVNRPLNEDDWNEASVDEVEKQGSDTAGQTIYHAEKVLSEKAAWSFYNENKNHLGWDLTVVLPTYIFGPYVGTATSPSEMNFTSSMFYNFLVAFDTLGQPRETLASTRMPWIDVRDLSLAMAKLLVVKEADVGRIILSTDKSYSMQDWVNAANSLSPSPIPSHAPGTPRALPVGNPGAGSPAKKPSVNTSKEKRILGLRYRTMEECLRDTLADYERRGW